jgi:hypothetical protein
MAWTTQDKGEWIIPYDFKMKYILMFWWLHNDLFVITQLIVLMGVYWSFNDFIKCLCIDMYVGPYWFPNDLLW